jgi:peptidoglycan L-alanyl-D-glutamate endopeptidase CwlK
MRTGEEKLNQIHPIVKEKALELIKVAKREGINILITQGLRTIEEQNQLYAKGRTAPGKKVTNAKGGYSYHNYGLAFDFAIYNKDGRTLNWNVDNEWMRVGELGESLGLEWGGRWTSFKDYPHFQLTFGLSIDELRSGARALAPTPKKEVLPLENKKEDQTVSKWAAEAQQWVIEQGISDGKDPKKPVTREEVWTMIKRAFSGSVK